QASGQFVRDPERDRTGDADAAAGIARALDAFTTGIGRETAASGFGAYLDNPARAPGAVARRHLGTIARDLKELGRMSVAGPVQDRSAGVGALSRLGQSLRGLAGGGNTGATGLMSRDYIGMASSLLAILFVLLLQTNRRRFQFRPLPDPPDTLGPQTTYREP
ncbi:MAG: hypothetical protein ACR2PM_14895, partial [Hyphomicrobiales bacterium]